MTINSLPARPSLIHLKAQAIDLQKAYNSSDLTARSRVAAQFSSDTVLPKIPLARAQLAVAREYGFASWSKLRAHITGADRPTKILNTDIDYNNERALAVREVQRDALPGVIRQIKRYLPRLAKANASVLKTAQLTDDECRLIYARAHGFESWQSFSARVAELAADPSREPFLQAKALLESHDTQRFSELLEAHPDLALDAGSNDNTLLAFAVSRGYQRIAEILIHAGADVNQANNRGWTRLHDAGYSNKPEMAQLLIDHGASTDNCARGDGGTPLVSALFWGHREVASILSRHGVAPNNFRVAAGLGRLDLMQRFFDSSGKLTPEAGAHRGFYRPHSGFPQWTPSDSPQEILDEALTYAARSGRTNVLGFLIDHGANIDANPYRGTALIWAAGREHADTVNWLLDHGANVNQRATFGGPSHGQGVTALHLVAQDGKADMVRLLVARGADPSIKDDNYQSTPGHWASHFGHTKVAAFIDKGEEMGQELSFKSIHPIGSSDPQNMPVADAENATPFYEEKLGFVIASRSQSPIPSATIRRDDVEIRLVVNGEDPEQASCYIEVSDVDAAREDLLGRGLDIKEVKPMEHDGNAYRVFFVRDPDGLCYCIGQRQDTARS